MITISDDLKEGKSKFWWFLAYPDSLPSDWLDQICETGILFAISPLHEFDVNDDGTPKKPHYHVILLFNGPTTYKHVKHFTDALNQPFPKPLVSVRGAYEYFWHKNNPDKYQYDRSLVRHFNGAVVEDFYQLSSFEVNKIKIAIQEIILNHDIIEYSDLMDYLLFSVPDKDLYDVACNHTVFFNAYIRSRRHKAEKSI